MYDISQKEDQTSERQSHNPIDPELRATISKYTRRNTEYRGNARGRREQHSDQCQRLGGARLQNCDAAPDHAVQGRQRGRHTSVLGDPFPELAVQVEEVRDRRVPKVLGLPFLVRWRQALGLGLGFRIGLLFDHVERVPTL